MKNGNKPDDPWLVGFSWGVIVATGIWFTVQCLRVWLA